MHAPFQSSLTAHGSMASPMRAYVLAAFCLTATMPPAQAATPSFDCDGVHSEIEKLICADDALATLDRRLATTFARALARAPAGEVGDLRTSQLVWHAHLLKCGKADTTRACVVDAYDNRIRDLMAGAKGSNRPGT